MYITHEIIHLITAEGNSYVFTKILMFTDSVLYFKFVAVLLLI